MKRIHLILALWLLLAISTWFQMFVYEYFGKYDYGLTDYLVRPLASMATGIGLFFLLILPVFDKTLQWNKWSRFLTLSALGLFYSIIFILILHLFPILFYDNPSDYKKSIFGFFVADFHNVLKNYLFQIAVLFVFEYVRKETNSITRQKDLEIELNRTKLQLLKSQLQPHFLFNALNSVVAEIDIKPAKAQDMLINISDVLRVTLDSDFMEPVTLAEELTIIEKYLSIEKNRYEDQLIYQIAVSDKALQLKVPKLILQAIVENAIKHGFRGMETALTIKIEASFEQKVIYIKNNGSKLNRKPDFGTGLTNVSERLKIFTGQENAFEIYQDDQWIINKISLK
ncbi:sensor histidine kinase [Flavobacterium cerinum]|uniref:Histidine kinase n=1 Tax=Flavobacterium cerinum TaxID=2502784 RepID=A0ABY5IQP2_9FLAO|nr:histidine kinase [Flavobacterium cerinum]UUC45162.1 histidine kinase [Flavobacterium cerinum]